MFPFFNRYPGTDLHEIDLAYILKLCSGLESDNKLLLSWKKTHEAEYAELLEKVDGLINNLVDVISPWDSSIAYHIFSLVEYQGANYIAVQDVPVGAMITNTDYWQPANTVIEQINAIGQVVDQVGEDMDKALNYYLTPQQFGAKGDGETDDTQAFLDAVAEIESRITRKTYSDGDPAESVGGVGLYIPAGQYVLTSSVAIPNNADVKGAGVKDSILLFSGTEYGLSLKGTPYNGLRYWRGNISDITVVMDGDGIGLSNAEYCDGTSAGQNAVTNSTFRNIAVYNAEVGMAIIGGWCNLFENLNIKHCLYGMIQSRLSGINGNNMNVMQNVSATSCCCAGFWLDMSGAMINAINAESAGDTYLHTYSGQNVTVAGITFSVENPCGIYLAGKFTGIIDSPWFERLRSVAYNDLEVYAILIKTDVQSNNLPYGAIVINHPFFNTDVYHPIRTLVACILEVNNPSWTYVTASGYFADIYEETWGEYTFRGLSTYLVDKIYARNKTAYNRLRVENVDGLGAQGVFDKYINSDIQNYNIIENTKFKYVPNSAYDLLHTKRVQTNNSTLYRALNGVTVEGYSYASGKEFIAWPKNVAHATTTSGTRTITVTFGNAYHNTSDTFCGVLLSARSAAGAALIAGGYYWSASNPTTNTITITFVNTPTSAETFDVFVFHN